MPVAVIPGIIAGSKINPDIAGIIPIVSGIGSVGIRTAIIYRASDSNADTNVNSGIGLAGEAQHSQQRND
jgi:hypothetical protein